MLLIAGALALLLQAPVRTVAIDERLAADKGIRIGDTVAVSANPDSAGERVVISAFVARSADPSEIARNEYRAFLHLDHLQRIAGYGDRVDRFAVRAHPGRSAEARQGINESAFGFRAHSSREIAVETSRTFQVVSRFHRAIGIITIVASSIFLLCIMLLKVEERRRDVAALRLMGISRTSVVKTIVAEAALVSVLGSALGIVIGLLSNMLVNWRYQGIYRTPLSFAIVTPEIIVFAVAVSLVLGIGAGMIASIRLARAAPLSLFGR